MPELVKIVLSLIGILIGGIVYFLPAMVGYYKRHFDWIMLLNFLFGWSIIGWMVLIIWAARDEVGYVPVKRA